MPSLYVHVPFCLSKCAYCAFYSLPIGNRKEHFRFQIAAYLDGLALEVEQRIQDAPEGVSSLFIGGGTPTALSEEELKRLLKILDKFCFSPNGEKTMEANPGTLTLNKLEILRAWGINRLSIGVQSFSDRLLKRIGRIHTRKEALQAIRLAREAGFTNINFDLMFGLPGQTMDDWRETLEEALFYQPEHLSLYGLMIEEGSRLERELKNPSSWADLPDDDTQADMYAWAVDYLRRNGYDRYETSNFAKPGFPCRHNLNYWQGEEYIGIGPGAFSFLNNKRKKNIEDIHLYKNYLEENSPLLYEEEELSKEDLMVERMILGLRMELGVDLLKFEHDFGVKAQTIYGKVLERYEKEGIFIVDDRFWKLNPDYAFVANAFLKDFF